MIKVEQGDKTQKAIGRCKAIRPMVKALDLAANLFQVSSKRGHSYRVQLAFKNGMRLAQCNCPAGDDGMLCYHVVAAIGVEHGIRGRWKSVNRPGAQTEGMLVKRQPPGVTIEGMDV